MKIFITLFITILNAVFIITAFCIYYKLPDNFYKDTTFNTIMPLIIAFITLMGAIPTYLFNKHLDRHRLENDIEKERELKKQREKEEKYKSLIPYIFLKRSSNNFIFFKDDKEIKILASKEGVSFENPVTTPSFDKKIYDYAQIKITETIWFLYTFASSEVIEAVHKFNKGTPSSDNSNNRIEFETLINAIRNDLGNPKITFYYGNG